MDPQQTQQTEKLIEEMLEFLETTSEEEEDLVKSPSCKTQTNGFPQTNHITANGLNSKEKSTKLEAAVKKEKKSKKRIAKELKKLKEEFPIWNTKEIVTSSNKSISLPQSPTRAEVPIWRSESSVSLVNRTEQPLNDGMLPENEGSGWYAHSDVNSRDNSDAIYVHEVRRSIYGDAQGHPLHGSPDYHEAAQMYAVYGKDFLDFPSIDAILTDRSICSVENRNAKPHFGSDQYSAHQGTQDVQSLEPFNFNNFGKRQPPSPGSPSTSSAPTVAAVASTAAYYQLCNGMQQRSGSVNNVMGSTTYGMFLGNKVTYLATTPTAPTLMYNQQNATTANFISNSLANAALATSPAILYSNPMLNANTQQYLNAFFKESQLLNSGSNSNQTTTTGFYERLVYAQMLQQQIYHQNQQQAAAVAAMIQHKQRVNAAAAAAAAAAAVSARQTSSGSTNVPNTNVSNGIQTFTNSKPSIAVAGSSTSPSPLKCEMQSAMVANSSSDLISLKQQGSGVVNQAVIAINGKEESSSVVKE